MCPSSPCIISTPARISPGCLLFFSLLFALWISIAISYATSHLYPLFTVSIGESYGLPPPDCLCLSWVCPRSGVCIPLHDAQRFIITGAHREGVPVKIASSQYRQTYNLHSCRVFPPTVESLWEQLEELDENPPSPPPTPQPPLTEQELTVLSCEASPLDPSFLTAHSSPSPSSSITPLTDLLSSPSISVNVPTVAPILLSYSISAPIPPSTHPALALHLSMATTSMPSRSDPKAPKFDATRPRELHPYFEELDFHFWQAGLCLSSPMQPKPSWNSKTPLLLSTQVLKTSGNGLWWT